MDIREAIEVGDNRNDAVDTRLVSIESFSASDIEIFGDWHRNLGGTLIQLDPGEFQGDTNIIDLHDVLLVKRKSNLRYFDCGSMPGYINFVFPLNAPGPIFATETQYSEVKQVIFSDQIDTCSCALYPEKFEQILVGIKVDTLRDYLSNEEADIFLSRINSGNQIIVEKRYKEMATQFAHHMYKKLLGSYEDSPDKELSVGQYNRLIILYLYDYISNSSEHTGATGNASNYEKILDRALHFIIHQDGAPLSMERLSSEIFASKRSIQYAFSKLLGMTPMEFSKLSRLNAIKGDLLDRDKNGVAVSHILNKYHITNPGRFRHEYFNFFGEYPRDTIA